MENIKTTNIISTPNIEGNIGTCTVKNNEVKVGNRFLTADYKSVQINSCTGQIITESYYTSYLGVWAVCIIGFITLLVIIIAGVSSSDY